MHLYKKKIQFLTIGQINSPHGILGWMNFYSFTNIKSQVFTYQPWYCLYQNKYKKVDLKQWKPYKKNFLIKIKTINDRTTACQHTQCKIAIQSNILPILKNNNYYLKDIIGCRIMNSKKIILGIVKSIISSISQDILVVKDITPYACLNKSILIPFILNKIILKVNISKKIIQVNWNYIFEKEQTRT
ncbi:ribosome maturation factor RimM [Buchnera aphidicola (Hormaphis cornu)]|nr:ribosome maturation factor RimM [Buchnera aphidicola (Hormaphis cornu)]